MEDKTLQCKECGQEFIFTKGEQEFYKNKGFDNEPQRCKPCRYTRKQTQEDNRPTYTVACASCGKEAQVPFQPKEDRPVYCSDCFTQLRDAHA